MFHLAFGNMLVGLASDIRSQTKLLRQQQQQEHHRQR